MGFKNRQQRGTPIAAPESQVAEAAEIKGAVFDVEAKIEAIRASRLSEEEKTAYIARLRGDAADPMQVHRIPFSIYANIKQIRNNVRIGMLAYPKAKGVAQATVPEWDTIFKDF